MSNFEQQAKQALDKQAETLNSDLSARLRHARETALESASNKPLFLSVKWLTGAGAGLAIASVLTFVLVPKLMPANDLSPFDDLELLTAETELDVVTHLEFYEWLSESLEES